MNGRESGGMLLLVCFGEGHKLLRLVGYTPVVLVGWEKRREEGEMVVVTSPIGNARSSYHIVHPTKAEYL